VPDTRSHRGLHPEDEHLFGEQMRSRLKQATDDLCWLLSRGYAIRSAVELVGNRHSLSARQRLAVARCACSEEAARNRMRSEIQVEEVRGGELWIDGLNILTGLEVALSGGIILIGRDQCYRDVAGVHRHYRKVEETFPAVQMVGQFAETQGIRKCCWWLDKPVSSTGRLRALLLDAAAGGGWEWEVNLVLSPDAILAQTEHVVVTSDSVVLDRCQRWLNLARLLLAACIPHARILDLS
jgi:hypothetical protein